MAYYPLEISPIRVPVFISSTIEDLRSHRAEMTNSLSKLGWPIVKNSELIPAGPYKPLDKCLQEVEESQIYLGLVGWRYGTVIRPPFSVTECEYNRAKFLRLYRVVVLERDREGARSDDRENVIRFRNKVMKHWVGWFENDNPEAGSKAAALEAITAICARHSKMTAMCIEVNRSWEDFSSNACEITMSLRQAIAGDCVNKAEAEHVWITHPATFVPGRIAFIVLLPHQALRRYLNIPQNKRKGGVVDAEVYIPRSSSEVSDAFCRAVDAHSTQQSLTADVLGAGLLLPILLKIVARSADSLAIFLPWAALLILLSIVSADSSPADAHAKAGPPGLNRH